MRRLDERDRAAWWARGPDHHAPDASLGDLIALAGDHVLEADAIGSRRLALHACLVDCHSPTETLRVHAWHEIGPAPDGPARPPSDTGSTVALLAVLDPHNRPAGIGEMGAVTIRSRRLADGYPDPALTAERFVPMPGAGDHDCAGGPRRRTSFHWVDAEAFLRLWLTPVGPQVVVTEVPLAERVAGVAAVTREIRLPMRSLFKEPTVAGVAGLVARPDAAREWGAGRVGVMRIVGSHHGAARRSASES